MTSRVLGLLDLCSRVGFIFKGFEVVGFIFKEFGEVGSDAQQAHLPQRAELKVAGWGFRVQDSGIRVGG